MERKVGEIFEYNGEWYQCIVQPKGTEGQSCSICSMNFGGKCPIHVIECAMEGRSDGKSVIFKKLEKVGEPYKGEGKIFQPYQAYIIPVPKWDYEFFMLLHQETKIIDIEVKQNKENMGEKKLNLKPFDLEAAKAGNPVCTRDGRKARIICFDYKGDSNAYPILALISTINSRGVPSEIIAKYTEDGRYVKYNNVEYNEDLMMLPQKNEGWIIIHKEAIYDKETAEKIARETTANVIRIQKIEWEE